MIRKSAEFITKDKDVRPNLYMMIQSVVFLSRSCDKPRSVSPSQYDVRQNCFPELDLCAQLDL